MIAFVVFGSCLAMLMMIPLVSGDAGQSQPQPVAPQPPQPQPVQGGQPPSPNQCPSPNEEWKVCSKLCPPTCPNRHPICPYIACTPAMDGCACKDGFIRMGNDTNTPCVPVDRCPVCKANEVWSQTDACCQASCDNPTNKCTKQCFTGAGCVCSPDFIRQTDGGPCVPKTQCPGGGGNHLCPAANEVWSESGSCCQASCANPGNICYKKCFTDKGCVCTSGYIRKTDGGPCVPNAQCSGGGNNQCQANEVYDGCYHNCENSCTEPSQICTMQCGPGGCACANGYVRERPGGASSGGKCVPKAQCPPAGQCKANEVYDKCYHNCENSCQNPSQACTKICGPGGCQCAPGYVREGPGGASNGGNCVLKEQCGEKQ